MLPVESTALFRRVRLIVRASLFIVGLTATMAPARSLAEEAAAACPGTDFVGVARHESFVVLGTAARTIARDKTVPYLFGPRGLQWRFRVIPTAVPLATFEIDRSGATATVRFSDSKGTAGVVDLTRDILELSPEWLAPPRVLPATDQPAVCELASDRRQNFDQQIFDVMQARSAGTPASIQALSWTFFAIEADPRLYAPDLVLTKQEAIVPEDFAIWTRLTSDRMAAFRQRIDADHKEGAARSRALKATYLLYRQAHPKAPATVYWHRHSYPGSWLFEYWLYYPIDEGGLDEHVHDSEHFFVEVDKLGGLVRRVVGAAHGRLAPNNEFGTFRDSVPPISMPLRVLVEQGKHATAPDIDHDGLFVPGLDTNVFRDVSKVWGIRDATGVTDSAFRAFETSMAGGRSERTGLLRPWWRSPGVSSLPDADKDPLRVSCGTLEGLRPDCYVLVELPTTAGSEDCAQPSDPTPACAVRQILGHEDFVKPYRALKQGYFPALALRAGLSLTPTKQHECRDDCTDEQDRATETSKRLTIGAAAEISSIPFGPGLRLPVAGRVAVDLLLDPSPSRDPKSRGFFDGFAVRYEKTLTNLFGAYLGFTRDTDELTTDDKHPGDGLPNPANWVNGGASFELPFKRSFIIARFGVAYSNVFGLAKEFQVGTGLAFGTPHRRFGIVRRAPNPYSR